MSYFDLGHGGFISLDRWRVVDQYITDALVGSDDVLDEVVPAIESNGLHPHHVSPNHVKKLHLLAASMGARRTNPRSSIWKP